MGIKKLLESKVLELWDDVYDVSLDDKAAPDLGDVVSGKGERIYSNADEFFRRTHVTNSIRNLLEDVVKGLSNDKGGSIFLLTSLFGGGKTHTQIFLYHAFNSPDKLSVLDDKFSSIIAGVDKPLIVVMDGTRASLIPNPKEPYKVDGFTIRTIWGMLAYRLGVYAKAKHFDSEDSSVPSVDTIRGWFSDVKEPVIILLDEIVHYVFNMINSGYKEYGNNVLLFLDYLARAVESSPRVVLVVSIQAEYRKEGPSLFLIPEKVFEDVAHNVLKSLRRESTKIVVPVAPDDVAEVLKKRIFKKIDENEAFKARDRIYKYYREHNIFGSEADWQFSIGEEGRIVSLRDTYPFHTKYVEVLHEFVTRNKDLQKTRDAIRITRKVIRRFLERSFDADFIMPWHIDLSDRDIRRLVLSESKKEFDDIARKELISENGELGSVNNCSKPQLALCIGTAVLLKTYTYDAFNVPMKVFPDAKDVALMVFEPETFEAVKIGPADIITVLNEMEGKLHYFVSESGKYWFTVYPSIIEYVEKRAEELLRGSRIPLYNRLRDDVKKIITERVKGEGGFAKEGAVFDENNTVVIGYGDNYLENLLLKDSPSLKLVVLVKPDVKEDDVNKLILMSGESGKRTFRNSVAVVCPKDDSVFDELLSYVAKEKACEDVEKELEQYYADKEIRQLQQRKLKKYYHDVLSHLTSLLLSALTKIYYPARRGSDDVVAYVLTSSETSLVLQVEKGLQDPKTGPKLRIKFDFDDLSEFLKRNLNWDLIEGSERREFKEIVNAFFMVTSAPFTTREAIQYAILNGLERLDVGILMDGKLYWKRIGPDDGCEKPSVLNDNAEILSYRIAAEMLKDKLLKESGVRQIDNEVHKVWYEVKSDNKSLVLEELIKQENWQKILKEGIIIRHEEVFTSGFVIDVKPNTVSVKHGEEVIVDVNVSPVHGYSYNVELIVEKGEIIPSKGLPSFVAKWRVGVLEPGNYTFKITGKGGDGKITNETLLTVIVESEEVEIEVKELDEKHIGAKLVRIRPDDMLALKLTMDTASKLNWKVNTSMDVKFADEISFIGKRMNPGITRIFAEKFNEIIGSIFPKVNFNSIVNIEEQIILDSMMINVLRTLFGKVVFVLRVKRSG
ncbi:MAG: DUF499 domain-containing protein [Thermoprotei archaeon]